MRLKQRISNGWGGNGKAMREGIQVNPQMAQIFADKTIKSAAIGEICGGKEATVWQVHNSSRGNFPETFWPAAGIPLETLNHSTATNIKSS